MHTTNESKDLIYFLEEALAKAKETEQFFDLNTFKLCVENIDAAYLCARSNHFRELFEEYYTCDNTLASDQKETLWYPNFALDSLKIPSLEGDILLFTTPLVGYKKALPEAYRDFPVGSFFEFGIRFATEEYTKKGNNIVKFSHAHAAFIHYMLPLNRSTSPLRHHFDLDNVETKTTLDAIHRQGFLVSDNGAYLSTSYESVQSDKEYTEIYITGGENKVKLLDFLGSRKVPKIGLL
jgi:hypothetical protein